ncbi:MAG TPA: polymer-forming cytoskeletal protein [Solirubrobacteraceae bacterium]|nr:polymer-forming cytoskeletal protein [Solirubrobacteraceae bacterium]
MRRSLLVALLLLCWLVPAANASADATADGDDRIVLVGSVLVDREQTAANVVVLDGDLTIRGTVTGDVIVVAGDVTIRGTVQGDVVTVAGLATLGRAGRVQGDIVYADDKPVLTPGAQVAGEVRKFDVTEAGIVGAIGAFIAITLSMFLLGLILLLLAPRAADAVDRTARAKAGVSVLVGLLAFFLIPIIAIAAFFTVVGIPLGIVLLLLLLPLYAISYITAAFALGRRILKGSRILALLVGLVILQLLTLIPIAGGLIGFVAVIFGLGLLLMTLVRARS